MTITISESELLDALTEAAESNTGDGGALTMREIMGATGLSHVAAMNRMHRLNAQGRIIPTKVRRVGLDGRNALVPAYRVVAPTEQPKKKAKR